MSTPQSQLQVLSQAQEVKFATLDVQPPSNVYVGREDAGTITSNCSATGVTLEVHGRILRPDGQVIPFVQAHVPNSDRTAKTDRFEMPEGFLLNVAVFLTAGTAKRGQCYVVVKLGRGSGAARVDHQVILQGYVGNSVNQAWPGNRLETPTEGPGHVRVIVGTTPAAGADFLETVPTGARWRLISFLTQLTTSAVVANRQVAIRVDDGVNGYVNWQAPAVQAASLAWLYTFAPGAPQISGPSAANPVLGLPTYIMLKGGFRFRGNTGNLDVGDQWSAPQYCVEEWLEP